MKNMTYKHVHEFKILWNTTVWVKGQVIIPKEIRDSMGIKWGDSLTVVAKYLDDRIIWFWYINNNTKELLCYIENELNMWKWKIDLWK